MASSSETDDPPERQAAKPMTPEKVTYEARMRALTLRRKLASTAKRFANIAAEVHRWTNAPDLREAATKIEAALASMVADADTTPDSFQPERERKGSARHLAPGAKVTLREVGAPKYDGILDPHERVGLEVVSVSSVKRGRVVSAKTVSGVRLVLPRTHIARVPTNGEHGAAPANCQ